MSILDVLTTDMDKSARFGYELHSLEAHLHKIRDNLTFHAPKEEELKQLRIDVEVERNAYDSVMHTYGSDYVEMDCSFIDGLILHVKKSMSEVEELSARYMKQD